LEDIQTVLGNVPVVLAREITKKFEEVQRGTAGEILKVFESRKPKGEYVVLVNRRISWAGKLKNN